MKTKLLQTLEITPKPTTKHFKIWTGKKFRNIAEPEEPLKTQLSNENKKLLELYEKILKEYGLEEIPQAYRKNRGVHTNAIKHKKNKIWYRFDFKSFYDTIKLEDFMEFIRPRYKDIRLRKEEYKQCFIDPKTNGLIQGSPTSGTLAGIALVPFWIELKKKLPKAVITQYSDDLCISNTENKSQKEIEKIINECIKKAKLKVRLNTSKTRQDKNQYRCLTGVACNHKDEMTCYRKNYRKLRAIFDNMEKNPIENVLKINNETPLSLAGKISYINHIDETGKINKLKEKYEKQMNALKSLCIIEQAKHNQKIKIQSKFSK